MRSFAFSVCHPSALQTRGHLAELRWLASPNPSDTNATQCREVPVCLKVTGSHTAPPGLPRVAALLRPPQGDGVRTAPPLLGAGGSGASVF